MPRVHSLLRTGACVFIWLISGEALADDAGSTASADAADRKSLLEAWEQNQKSDPFTVEFEQTAPGVYHLKTTRFPYDGSVKVTSMVIRFLPNQGGTGPSKYGVVEPTLDQDIEKIQSQYPESFGDWRTRNYFQSGLSQR
jgi:hypothetical protein